MELVGRIIYALPLALMGVNHFLNLKAMTSYAESKKLPVPQLSVILSGIILIIGLLGIVFNFQTKIAGWLVVAFLLISAILMHNFWTVEDENMKMVEMTQFLKNVALAGGAIAIIYLI